MFLHGVGQSLRRIDPDDLIGARGDELAFERMRSGGIAIREKNFQGLTRRGKHVASDMQQIIQREKSEVDGVSAFGQLG